MINSRNILNRITLVLLIILLLSAPSFPAHSGTCPQISAHEVSQQMDIFGKDIRYHNHLYYEKAQPVISDADYDLLYARLVQLEECFPALITDDSPTKKVGSGVGGEVRKVKHEQSMISLTSTTGSGAVETLLKRVTAYGKVQFLVQPKVDGLPVELVYETGRLQSASTRGDGRFGEDVTERVRKINGIPHQLTGTFPARVVVRGEVYANLPLLNNLADITPGKNAAPRHPRHVAAGALQALNPDPAIVATLRLFPFDLVTAGLAGSNVRSDRAALELLSQWGFPVAFDQIRTVRSLADVRDVYRSYLANREQQPFAMDGIVVKVDDLNMRHQLGEGQRAPFWAAAWKFSPDTARTQVLKLSWTTGRTGRRTPVAEVMPVRLGGVTVSRVSLHNEAEIARLDIATGDHIVVELVGDVIPQVLEVVERVPRKFAPGTVQAKAPDSALDACLHDSPVCRNQFVARTAYFVSKSGINVAGLGRGRLQKLIEAGLIVDLPSLFLLKAESVATVPGFGMKTAQRLTTAIRAVGEHLDSFKFVTALGIPGVGPKSVQRLARQFTTLDKLLAAEQEHLNSLSVADIRAAKTVHNFFQTTGGKELLMKFRELGVL